LNDGRKKERKEEEEENDDLNLMMVPKEWT